MFASRCEAGYGSFHGELQAASAVSARSEQARNSRLMSGQCTRNVTTGLCSPNALNRKPKRRRKRRKDAQRARKRRSNQSMRRFANFSSAVEHCVDGGFSFATFASFCVLCVFGSVDGIWVVRGPA